MKNKQLIESLVNFYDPKLSRLGVIFEDVSQSYNKKVVALNNKRSLIKSELFTVLVMLPNAHWRAFENMDLTPIKKELDDARFYLSFGAILRRQQEAFAELKIMDNIISTLMTFKTHIKESLSENSTATDRSRLGKGSLEAYAAFFKNYPQFHEKVIVHASSQLSDTESAGYSGSESDDKDDEKEVKDGPAVCRVPYYMLSKDKNPDPRFALKPEPVEAANTDTADQKTEQKEEEATPTRKRKQPNT